MHGDPPKIQGKCLMADLPSNGGWLQPPGAADAAVDPALNRPLPQPSTHPAA